MKSNNFNNPNAPKKVLVAPLDWGLGHATRCIPIINELLKQNFEVVIAASGKIEALLKTEFPQLRFVQLFGYNVKYSKYRWLFYLKMGLQIPKIVNCISKENAWLAKFLAKEKFDIVISDNRYGLRHKNVVSIFITHQLYIETKTAFTNNIIQKINYILINKFNLCWVVDENNNASLAGKLSNPNQLPQIPTHYIGYLSRFSFWEMKKTIDVLVILSGPEPQRTCLEEILLEQLKQTKLKIVFVRGVGVEEKNIQAEGITFLNNAASKQLNELVLQANLVISRSGYTSIMDYAATAAKALLIPTPGQTEQEYLSQQLSLKGYCFTSTQAEINLPQQLHKYLNTSLQNLPKPNHLALAEAIRNLL
jgi:uncharacterized protein (TIGR00661 family)